MKKTAVRLAQTPEDDRDSFWEHDYQLCRRLHITIPWPNMTPAQQLQLDLSQHFGVEVLLEEFAGTFVIEFEIAGRHVDIQMIDVYDDGNEVLGFVSVVVGPTTVYEDDVIIIECYHTIAKEIEAVL